MKIDFVTGPQVAGGKTRIVFVGPAQRDTFTPAISKAEFPTKVNATLFLREQNLLLVGIGDVSKIDAQIIRSAAGTAIMFLKRIARTKVLFDAPDFSRFSRALVEGSVLADYRFEQFKTTKTAPLHTLHVVVPESDLAECKRSGLRGKIVAESVNYARDIGNQPGNIIYPNTLAKEAEKLAKKTSLKVTVLDEKALRASRFGGILAVGAGSTRPPRLIILEHCGGGNNRQPIALVGKAITFDSGGISIKPASGMEEMIFDKSGGIAVLGAMRAISVLNLPSNVIGIIASAENMPGPGAYRPGDIVTTYDGKHVEIVNTDAEGRMVLADAISYARKDRRARTIIDLATLTGACGVALGECAAGLWSTSNELKNQLLDAGEKAGERLWSMPLYPEYDELIKSEVALIKNSGGRLAGACTGAAFLKTFAEGTPWGHMDIAYMASIAHDRPDLARGATGFGIRALVALIESWKAPQGGNR